MLKTSSSSNSSTSVTQIVVGYDGVDDGGGCSGDFDRKFHQLLTSRLRTSFSTDSSTNVTQSVVKNDEVVGAIGKSVRKLSKSRQKSRRIVKEPKKLQRSEKSAKDIGSEERLPKHRSSVNKELELLLKALTVFRALFAVPKSSLDTTFASIIDKGKLIELLMRCPH